MDKEVFEIAQSFMKFYVIRAIRLYGFGAQAAEIEDIVQECYVSLIQSNATAKDGVKSYMKSLARCVTIDYIFNNNIINRPRRTKTKVIPRRGYLNDYVDENSGSIKLTKHWKKFVYKSQTLKDFGQLEEALQQVRENYAEALRHKYGIGEPETPIAEYSRNKGLSRATVRVRIDKGIKQLRKILRDDHDP